MRSLGRDLLLSQETIGDSRVCGAGTVAGFRPGAPRHPQHEIQQRLGHRGPPLGLRALCEPWEKPRGTILAFGALGCREPALRVGGSRRPGRRRGESPALKLGAQFWGLLRPQLDSQDSRSELHARGTEPWAGGPIMPSPAPLRLRGLDGVSIEGGRRVAASRSLAVQTWG